MIELLAFVVGVVLGWLYGRDEAKAVVAIGVGLVVLSLPAFVVGAPGLVMLLLGVGAVIGVAGKVGSIRRAGGEAVEGASVLGTVLTIVAALMAACNLLVAGLVVDSFGEPIHGTSIVAAFTVTAVGLAAGLGARAVVPDGTRRRIATWSLWTNPVLWVVLLAAST